MASGNEHNLPTNAEEAAKKNRRTKGKSKDSHAADVTHNFSPFPEHEGDNSAQECWDKRLEQVEVGMEALNARLSIAEDNLETLKKYLLDQMEAIKGNVTSVKQDVETIKNNVDELVNAEDIRKREFYASESKLMDVVIAIQDKVVAIEKKISADKKLDVPKPKDFKGDAQEVENFIWQLEEYFEHLDISEDKDKIKQASMYLTDTAMLWWRWKKNVIGKGTCKIDTWDKFNTEFKQKFYPTNAAFEARKKLRDFKQTGTVQDYVKDFTTLTLQIPTFSSPKCLLFNFLYGLQNWARQELLRRKVADIDEAIVAAESLIDYKADKHKNYSKHKQAKGGRE